MAVELPRSGDKSNKNRKLAANQWLNA